ncbi:sensor histidine kinase [Tepidiphilus margaritifer]|uniref:sensor histidine kinase n=1 Tax=Tepidiphilus margaritifer TaxID=203471 RepID=UPI00048DC398|nr:HAMP domain-containing sensor histidine kinase [Tepidiphilus margaritifer]
MKKRPRSLRLRLIAAFAFLGVALGPLIVGALLWASYALEEETVKGVVQERLQRLVASPQRFVLREHPHHPEIHVLSSAELENLPEEIFSQPDGIHEFELGHKGWVVGLATPTQGQRYAVIEDISGIERREWVGLFIVLAGAAFSGYVALWFGFYFSRRLLAPLTRLTERLKEVNDFSPELRLAEDDLDEEVLVLARALDEYRRRMSEALARERDFSADASHELRTPLTVILHAAELLAADPHLGERSRRAVARIEHAGARMAETIETLLLLAREPEATREEFDVVEVVREAMAHSELFMAGTGIVLEMMATAHPVIHGSSTALSVIVANLVRNAIQHAHCQRITVRIETDRLCIEDDGIGMSSAEKGASRGRGLVMVRRLCEREGWAFRLGLCDRNGRGTKIEVVFTAP